MDATIYPVGTATSSHGIAGLDPDSYTAHKLKHASPEHLHHTTRRFFIGPIPEGWLSSNRKSWYKRRLELSSYSSRKASFNAQEGQTHHQRTMTGLDRSAVARMSFSFPQPEDIEDSVSGSERDEEATATEDDGEEEDDEDDEELEAPRELEPVSTVMQEQDLPGSEYASAKSRSSSPRDVRKGVLQPTTDAPAGVSPSNTRAPQSPKASPQPNQNDLRDFRIQVTDSPDVQPGSSGEPGTSDGNRLSGLSGTDTRTSSLRQEGLGVQHDNVDAGSLTRLLSPTRADSRPPPKSRDGARSMRRHDPAPMASGSDQHQARRKQSEGVRFKVGEAVADKQRRVGRRAESARSRVGKKIARRQTLQEGTIVKMEKMLTRIDSTLQQVPDDYDENASMRVKTLQLQKWTEFMVVARRSRRSDEDDFRLQFYKTRVIPEIDDNSSKKKPYREIRLVRKSTHVNLFSSLDKSVVIWHPYKKGSRITIMKCESTAHSVEWYTFLRDALGWKRPDKLQVSVPDLGVALQIEKPFENMEAAGLEAEDEETALAMVAEAEQAVAGKIIAQCTETLQGNPEWTSVMQHWQANVKPGLAWKRYDRLEWIHGVNEQKMYGSMAMQHSYELELRPKVHYPQHAHGKKGKDHEEPPPIEGFLIRMTSQKGLHKRMGKTFFKRLYFSTHDHLLTFNRPAQATPPHPPRLQTITGANIPSSRDIIDGTPIMYDIDPFPLDNNNKQIQFLSTGIQDRINRADREAFAEARRNHANLSSSDGYINMTRIRTVRPMQWGTDSVDETLSSGSDNDEHVPFHASVPDTLRPDGTTTAIDDHRVFELILDNGLVVRLQAYDRRTRDEWVSRLKKLVKYWKLRKTSDMNIFKSIRAANLSSLKIDEDVEAELGQFGQKWEVTRSEASPELYNICSIGSCRTISLSGLLYRKARRHGTFQRCGVVLSGGQMLIYQSTLRKTSGAQVANIHQEKQQVIDLAGCYVYSGLIVEDDLLYQNRTFDANHVGTLASLPRVWTEDGWTSTDVDVMCCFVVWMNTRKGWFRTAGDSIFGTNKEGATEGQETPAAADGKDGKGRRRAKIKRVRQLGVPGRGIVFKCRSRAERDLWVLNLGIEIERLVERQRWEDESGEGEVRFAG
ncbi:hypothetical protein OHC33_002970 [Knufia fluminis]|uniref:PH domain-containing protein n=1 Tax=Knufia fluminis TaxID=191047 RepID=A0AAN8EQ68_9EURO|nr:hypothetical protein OHC33_002970 [Knufia fluminis]